MSTETATPPAVEVVAPAAVVEAPPAAPSSMAAAFAQASEKSSKAKATAAPAAVAEPAAKPAAAAPAKVAPAPAAKAADPLDAAAAEIADPNHIPLPFDDIEDETPVDEGKPDERVGRRIEILKGEIKETWKPKVAQLEGEIKQRDARLAELEAFAKERDELLESKKQWEAEMSVTKLEKTPAFIKEVTEPEGRIVESALKIIEHYGLNEKAIFAALEEPDAMKRSAAFKAATSGLDVDADHAYELRKLADEAQTVIAKRESLYKNADAALAELSAKAEKDTAAQLAARAEERGKATDLVVARISAKLPFVTEFLDKDLVKRVKETSFEALHQDKQAYNVLTGEAFPKLAVAHAKLQAQLDAALDEIASYTKASPRVDGGLSKAAGAGTAPRSMAEAAAMAAGSR